MSEMKLLTPHEAKAALDADDRAVYLDVRTVEEFAAGHPEGAWNLPVMERAAGGMMRPNPDFIVVAEKLLAKDQQILCGCQAGGRSQAAAQMLLQKGFGDVANVLGGWGGGGDPRSGGRVQGWRDAGLPASSEADGQTSHESLRRKAGL